MKNSFDSYAKRLTDALGEFIVHTLFTVIGYILLLYVAKIMWSLFLETPVGQHHSELFTERSEMLNEILFGNIFSTAFGILATCLYSGMIITAAGRFLHLYRPFYRTLDATTRTMLWGIPVIIYATRILYMNGTADSYGFAVALSLLPCLAFTRNTLRLNRIAIPEIGSLASGLVGIIKRI